MKTVILIGLALAAVGCERSDVKTIDTATRPQGTVNAETAPADNTKKNERDRDTSTLTPGDQGENEVDRTITQKIRQAVVKDDALSMTAKNVKIITVDGVVTLRGPVKSDKEKTDINALAQRVEGVKRVDNQLEIAAN
jgi:hyperosmotically inducible periplasmic protein